MPKPEPLYMTDAEIAARVGVTSQEWKAIACTLEKVGLPRVSELFGGKRYWPAVRAFLDRREGLQPLSPALSESARRNGEPAWTLKKQARD